MVQSRWRIECDKSRVCEIRSIDLYMLFKNAGLPAFFIVLSLLNGKTGIKKADEITGRSWYWNWFLHFHILYFSSPQIYP